MDCSRRSAGSTEVTSVVCRLHSQVKLPPTMLVRRGFINRNQLPTVKSAVCALRGNVAASTATSVPRLRPEDWQASIWFAGCAKDG